MNLRRKQWAALCALLWLGLLCGCATPPRLGPIRSDERIDFVVIQSAQADAVTRIRNQDLGRNTTVGAGSGMVVGALSGLGCGPFAWLCIPAGALVGGLTGTAAGAVVGLTASLSDDKAASIRERLGRVQQSRDIADRLRSELGERARQHWPVNADSSATVVTVDLVEQSLTSTRDDRIGLVVRVLVSVKPDGAALRAPMTQKQFEYVGPLSPLTAWLDEKSDFLELSLNSASQQLAAQIVSELLSN